MIYVNFSQNYVLNLRSIGPQVRVFHLPRGLVGYGVRLLRLTSEDREFKSLRGSLLFGRLFWISFLWIVRLSIPRYVQRKGRLLCLLYLLLLILINEPFFEWYLTLHFFMKEDQTCAYLFSNTHLSLYEKACLEWRE